MQAQVSPRATRIGKGRSVMHKRKAGRSRGRRAPRQTSPRISRAEKVRAGRILVALDGSKGAEAILAVLERMRGWAGDVLLLHVLGPASPLVAPPPRGIQTLTERAGEYLEGLRKRFPRLTSQAFVEIGEPSQVILEIARRENVDATALATHGRRGVRRVLLGSVAEAIVRESSVPVLLCPLQYQARPIRRILVALDGQRSSDGVLHDVSSIARAGGAEVILLHVAVPVVIAAEPSTGFITANLPDRFTSPEAWLSERVDRLRKEGIRARFVVARGPASKRIADMAESLQADLIAMATHAHSKSDRLLTGNVAARTLRRARRPILLKPVPAPARRL